MSKNAVSQTVDPADTLAVLKAAEEWLSNPRRWARGWYWLDARGGMVEDNRRDVAKCCAVGALIFVAGGETVDDGPLDAVLALAAGLGCERDQLAHVNDGPDGYARIMAGLRTAIETLEAERAA